MGNLVVKFLAVTLVLSMMISVASCGKNPGKNVRKVSEDSPWFDANIIEFETGADKEKSINYGNNSFAGSDEKYYVVSTSGEYENLGEFDYEKQYDNNFYFVSVVDRKTNETVRVIDLKKDFSKFEHFIDTVSYSDEIITARTGMYERNYDPNTGLLLAERKRGEKTNAGNAGDEEPSFSKFYKVGDYNIELISFQMNDNRFYYNIKIKAPDGKVNTAEVKRIDKSINIPAVLAVDDTKALVPVRIKNDTEYYELDLTSGEMILSDSKDYEWMDSSAFFTAVPGPDGMMYYKASHGISRLNAKTKAIEEIFKYSWCDLNEGLISNFELIECSEDRILLCGLYDCSSTYEGQKIDKGHLIELTRAEKNPNAGKTILELFTPRGINEITGEAISIFNENNAKCFIEISSRYDRDDYYDRYAYDDKNYDVEELARIRGSAGLSNRLAIDIMNGEGPDMLMDVSSYGQLNNQNCLVDLSPYLKDLKSDKYFTNIIEGSKTEGKLYQLPVSFYIEGIMTKTKNVGSSGKGFTFDEYTKFIYDTGNGKDPIYFGQSVYFAMLFNYMKDEFISNGKVDLSNEKFAQIADFVRDNVREEGGSSNEQDPNSIPQAVYKEYCGGIGGYFAEGMSVASWGLGVTIAGLPSFDGRGPRFIPTCSVAVSAQASDIKACAEFVNVLLSDEIQTKIAMNDSFVTSREAFKKAGESAIQYYSNGGNLTNGGNGYSSSGFGREFTSEDVAFVEKMILSCSQIKTEDSDISIILIEEMPAYFLGQKDLDAVIKIAQNRIQKVLDERG